MGGPELAASEEDQEEGLLLLLSESVKSLIKSLIMNVASLILITTI